MNLFLKTKNLIYSNYLFQHYPISKQFIKFCLVGLTNLAVDVICYWLLTRYIGMYYILAAIISFLAAVSWSFYFNRRWTFRHTGLDIHRQYVKFFITSSVGAAINISLLYMFVDISGMYDILAKFIASFIVAFINFILSRYWAFRLEESD